MYCHFLNYNNYYDNINCIKLVYFYTLYNTYIYYYN